MPGVTKITASQFMVVTTYTIKEPPPFVIKALTGKRRIYMLKTGKFRPSRQELISCKKLPVNDRVTDVFETK
jgi:hypothetical protein